MPQQTEIITVSEQEEERLLLQALAAFKALQWKIVYTDDKSIVAHTPRKWNKWNDEVTVNVQPGQLTVTSKLIHGESFDALGKNKKHIAAFKRAFEPVSGLYNEEKQAALKEELANHQNNTKQGIEDAAALILETGRVMGTGKPVLTYAIMGINVLLFVLMIGGGVHLMDPSGEDIFKWGGNYGPATQSGEWWRLFTCMFIHIGIIHLVFNMYALYMVGHYLEPMIGKLNYAVAYLCTGIFASLTSLWWHSSQPVVSAGASGAIFGLYGVFLALLTTKMIPAQIRNALLQSIGVFVVYNLIYGMKSGVDNAAHIGGLVSGLVIGYLFYFSGKSKEQSLRFVSLPLLLLIIAGTAATGYFILKQNSPQSSDFSTDGSEFVKKIQHFEMYEELALEAANSIDTATSKESQLNILKRHVLNNWVQCANMVDESGKLNLSSQQEELRTMLKEYAGHRIEETKLLIRMYDEETEKYSPSLDSVQRLINQVMNKLKINTEDVPSQPE